MLLGSVENELEYPIILMLLSYRDLYQSGLTDSPDNHLLEGSGSRTPRIGGGFHRVLQQVEFLAQEIVTRPDRVANSSSYRSGGLPAIRPKCNDILAVNRLLSDSADGAPAEREGRHDE